MSRRVLMLALVAATALVACNSSPPPAAPPPKKKPAAGADAKAITTAATPTPSPSATASPTATVSSEPTATPAPVATPATSVAATPTPAPVLATTALALDSEAHVAGTWRAGPSLVRPRAGLGLGVAGGRLLACEGDSRPSFERLSADGDGWQLDQSYDVSLLPIPTNALQSGQYNSVAVSDGESLYLIGGDDLGLILRYDASGFRGFLGTLFQRRGSAVAGVYKGRLLVAGGYVDNDAARTAIADGTEWLPLDGGGWDGEPMPAKVAGAAHVEHAGKLWVFGGWDVDDAGKPRTLARVQVCDLATGKWTADGAANGPAPLAAPVDSAAAAVLGGKIYVVGGRGASGEPTDGVRIYDPSTNTWSVGPSMPTARALHGLAAHEGRLWAVGGIGAAKQALASVEVFRP